MPLHSALTGADLHESKGVDTAAANTVPVANGSGSTTWQKVGVNQVDATSIKNVNSRKVPVVFKVVTTSGSLVVPITESCTLTKVTACLSGAITTSNITITINKNGSLSNGTLTLNFTGSAKGSTFTLTPVSNNTYVASDYLEILSGGGTGGVDCTFLLEFTVT